MYVTEVRFRGFDNPGALDADRNFLTTIGEAGLFG